MHGLAPYADLKKELDAGSKNLCRLRRARNAGKEIATASKRVVGDREKPEARMAGTLFFPGFFFGAHFFSNPFPALRRRDYFVAGPLRPHWSD